MSNVEILLIVLGASIGVTGSMFYVLPMLKKRGIDVQKLLDRIEEMLKGTDAAVTVVSEIVPNNQALNIIDTIEKLAIKAVNEAQQLFISSQLPADQRKDKANEYIAAALNVLGINITPDLQTVINGTIEDAIFTSKTPDEVKGQEQITVQKLTTQLQQQVTQLQSDNTKLTQENTQLKQTLSNAQSSLQIVSQ